MLLWRPQWGSPKSKERWPKSELMIAIGTSAQNAPGSTGSYVAVVNSGFFQIGIINSANWPF